VVPRKTGRNPSWGKKGRALNGPLWKGEKRTHMLFGEKTFGRFPLGGRAKTADIKKMGGVSTKKVEKSKKKKKSEDRRELTQGRSTKRRRYMGCPREKKGKKR